ncbi:hypothetical protein SMACR_05537 [Sordaria macrospora]|uniref:WGS project CABT00000000 data, contig 2.26 n=2 Tax=Sordaria macrospora TaxID=5147 RepID=F7W405_SORMK|nr:uncharacterized protein SMAC_05537 [Sordaria macrospora k-hell]KAA8634237.1 hypothetical protein SMACR_05537 [Sordaria macrospora]WPJ59713.1 hypothetical protein SMAC4_05537 [Sordaria macrospora]CCC12359.1 unnamed protein product [Sordaria macrospora k-hell]
MAPYPRTPRTPRNTKKDRPSPLFPLHPRPWFWPPLRTGPGPRTPAPRPRRPAPRAPPNTPAPDSPLPGSPAPGSPAPEAAPAPATAIAEDAPALGEGQGQGQGQGEDETPGEGERLLKSLRSGGKKVTGLAHYLFTAFGQDIPSDIKVDIKDKHKHLGGEDKRSKVARLAIAGTGKASFGFMASHYIHVDLVVMLD